TTGFTVARMERTAATVSADGAGVHVAWAVRTSTGQGKIAVRNSPDGLDWSMPPVMIDKVSGGHQWNPDIGSADGVLRALFYDSRRDAAYAPDLPPGNTRDGISSGPAADAYLAQSMDGGRTWTERRLS